jgi:hypothetical protein
MFPTTGVLAGAGVALVVRDPVSPGTVADTGGALGGEAGWFPWCNKAKAAMPPQAKIAITATMTQGKRGLRKGDAGIAEGGWALAAGREPGD